MISIFSGAKTNAGNAGNGNKALGNLCEVIQENLIRARGLNHEELAADLIALAKAVEAAPASAAMEKVRMGVSAYFGGLSQSIDSLGTDLAISIRALATLLHDNADDQDVFLGRMEKLRDNFQGGQSLNDVASLRRHLDTCLEGLKSELLDARQAQQRRQGPLNEHMSKLHRSISALRSKVPPKHSSGPALCIVRIRRLKAIRDRYGDEVASRMLDYVIQLLLVRWPAAYDITPYDEECLVVVDSENLDLDFHRSALRRLSGEKNSFLAQVEGREMPLPLAFDWTVIRAPADGDMDLFIRNFLSGMSQQDAQMAALDQVLGVRA